MDTSFEEKSVWIQLVSLVIGLGGYLVFAGILVSNGIDALTAFVPFLVAAIVVIVAINIAGHMVVAIKNRTDEADERDQLIGCLAESRAAWILGVGVIGAIIALILPVNDLWVVHLLLVSLFASEIVKLVLQVVYYRSGI
ncbi:MAG: hypothetical protein OXG05_08360 [Gammaproteobacteria bacterium]|nr:hypothetical protein [Gammaproteobacteria bacterium]